MTQGDASEAEEAFEDVLTGAGADAVAIGRAEVGLLHARLSRSGGHSLDDSLVTVAMHLESLGEVYFKLGMHGAAAETWTAALKLFEAKGMSAWAAQVRGRVAALPGAGA